jgi:hypothetical protein
MRANIVRFRTNRHLRSGDRRGNAILELGLLAMPLVVMLLGTVVVGLNLGRSIQAASLNRDAGSMYVRGIDFSATFNRNLLIRLGQGLSLSETGGRGIVYFSKVTWMPSTKCTSLSLNPCNSNQHVIMQRLSIGDPSLRASQLGTPASNLIDARGDVANYMTNSTAIAAFPWMQLAENEYAWVAETYFPRPISTCPATGLARVSTTFRCID